MASHWMAWLWLSHWWERSSSQRWIRTLRNPIVFSLELTTWNPMAKTRCSGNSDIGRCWMGRHCSAAAAAKSQSKFLQLSRSVAQVHSMLWQSWSTSSTCSLHFSLANLFKPRDTQSRIKPSSWSCCFWQRSSIKNPSHAITTRALGQPPHM